MWSYRARLERDLTRWRSNGWISEAGSEAIRRDLDAAGRGIGLATVLAVLGAVLIGFAAMTFVAANWQDMARLFRLGLLVIALWGCYGLAGHLSVRGLGAFAQAAVLAGVGVFGASIMLVAQMYHIDGHPPDAVLVWAAGALLSGVLLSANAALAAAMGLVGLWSGWETVLGEAVHWPFLAGWAVVAAVFVLRRWPPGLHLSAITLGAWVVGLGYLLGDGHAHGLVVLIGLAAVGLTIAAERVHGPWRRLAPHLGPPVLCYGMVVAYAGLFALTFIEEPAPGRLAMLATATLAFLLAAVAWGWRTQQRAVLWLGYAGFSVEVLALYFKTVGTLIGTSLFFFVAGLIVIGLSWLAYRLHLSRPGPGEAVS